MKRRRRERRDMAEGKFFILSGKGPCPDLETRSAPAPASADPGIRCPVLCHPLSSSLLLPLPQRRALDAPRGGNSNRGADASRKMSQRELLLMSEV
jgi:hypothetical protein